MGRLLVLLVLWCNLAQAASVGGMTLPDTDPAHAQPSMLDGPGHKPPVEDLRTALPN